MDELHVNNQAAEYHTNTRYTSPLPLDFKHISSHHYAERKRKERQRYRIAGVLCALLLAVGVAVAL